MAGIGYTTGRFLRRHPGASVLIVGISTLAVLSAFSFRSFFAGPPKKEPPPIIAGRPEPPAPPTAEQQQRERDFQLVLLGASRLRDAMKKPETFELTDAFMIDHKTICYQYKARNSFNDVTREQYVLSDKVSSGSVAAWNKHCANKTGQDFAYVRTALKWQ